MVDAIETIYDEGARAVRFPAGLPVAVGAAG